MRRGSTRQPSSTYRAALEAKPSAPLGPAAHRKLAEVLTKLGRADELEKANALDSAAVK